MKRPLVLGLALAAIAAGAGWWLLRTPEAPPSAPGSIAIDPAHPDPADEGRTVSLTGELVVEGAAHDDPLGIGTRAPGLLREVAMYQWREHCDGDRCRYDTGWEDGAIDSAAFRQPEGHANPGEQPFDDAAFYADRVRIGALTVVPALLRTLPTEPLPATLGQLPPNLAASFSERDGVLYSGDPDAPAVGDLRIRYRQLQAGTVTLSGLQRGSELQPIP
ncbi:TMEM43 family protein [Dokdonella koreensis]|uniref:Uncharacterized protein n=1 Tax=Dokdonella koreensis DS-123 TaxID=1300342 RepID=A0A160DTT8_9GAMM|nr:TMEM43 family protein [Dokdonella koreensis]ANB17817.1 Hypothetical protein I596_1793 [Dokdonella koreensis DS-123]